MPPSPSRTVVRSSSSYNARLNRWKAYVSVFVVDSNESKYERHTSYFTTWNAVVTWFASWP